jgi:uncharacterized protein YjiS (DUF1127 family)
MYLEKLDTNRNSCELKGSIVSKCIDTISEFYPSGSLRDWIRRLFRSDLLPAKAEDTSGSEPATPAPASSMLMASRDIDPLITRTAQRLADWQSRRVSRRQLISLDDRMLKDIGISRSEAEHEYSKPFWRG